MKKAKLQRLVHQYFNDTISRADCVELLDYLNNTNPDEIADVIDTELINFNKGPEFKGKQSADVLSRIKSDPRFTQQPVVEEAYPVVVKFYSGRWFQIAAALLVFGTAALVIFNKNISNQTTKKHAFDQQSAAIVPGSNKAILTLAGGKTIVLKNAANGLLAQTGAGNVLKTNNGQILYNAANKTEAAASQDNINTLSTPRGGTYQVVLSDGTKVWLNAASSISYPVAFTGKERHITLTGEAYFEVAKNKEMPFYVSTNNVQIRVLGTHFNIAAYGDDNEVTATLLEGAVQITKNNAHSMLKPGQKAIINNNSDNIAVSEANIEDAMAWKNGYFIFDDDDIIGIMKKVSRWYDVSVNYQGSVSDQKFGGTFYRSKSITELLQYLGKIGKIHIMIEGRRIIVMK
ncbi:FecR family protein [Mucilaginibacter sp. BJC16-A38]|uniref:FecR family protein n=1 Tax=Mucilaginibacter phenanthrenivorans TaxID=1234842 RepID=UPI0021588738|nr:FecR family protein [Mucilaginibacter phenanthrenivorans]MCR8559790.1 FecR family protein [Mucilaginibacter phenanthrenivorans]